jgi:rhodanese-related sulfurtransferase
MKEVSPKQAFEMMQTDPGCIYLDVRSVPEFDEGHPEGAINIPFLHFTPGAGMSPNEDFPAVVETALEKDAKIVVGCKTGGRSARACELMSQMGFTDVANVRGGYVGVMDQSGQVVEPGWSLVDLPCSIDSKAEAQYQTLAKRAGKSGRT